MSDTLIEWRYPGKPSPKELQVAEANRSQSVNRKLTQWHLDEEPSYIRVDVDSVAYTKALQHRLGAGGRNKAVPELITPHYSAPRHSGGLRQCFAALENWEFWDYFVTVGFIFFIVGLLVPVFFGAKILAVALPFGAALIAFGSFRYSRNHGAMS